jgi:hypothetical protein
MIFSEGQLNAFNETIERKSAEGFRQAREVEMQPELAIFIIPTSITVSLLDFIERIEGPRALSYVGILKMAPELNRIYELYKGAIERHKINLRTKYDLGKKTFQQIEEVENLLKVSEILQTFETAIKPFLEEHKRLAMEIKDYEERIQFLLPADTLFTS